MAIASMSPNEENNCKNNNNHYFQKKKSNNWYKYNIFIPKEIHDNWNQWQINEKFVTARNRISLQGTRETNKQRWWTTWPWDNAVVDDDDVDDVDDDDDDEVTRDWRRILSRCWILLLMLLLLLLLLLFVILLDPNRQAPVCGAHTELWGFKAREPRTSSSSSSSSSSLLSSSLSLLCCRRDTLAVDDVDNCAFASTSRLFVLNFFSLRNATRKKKTTTMIERCSSTHKRNKYIMSTQPVFASRYTVVTHSIKAAKRRLKRRPVQRRSLCARVELRWQGSRRRQGWRWHRQRRSEQRQQWSRRCITIERCRRQTSTITRRSIANI